MNRYIQKNFEKERRDVKRVSRSLKQFLYIGDKKNPWLKRTLLKLYKGILLWIYFPGSSFRRQIVCRLGFHKFSWQHYELKRLEEPGRVIIHCDICSKILGVVAFDDLPQWKMLEMVCQVQDLRSRQSSVYYC